MRSTWWAGKAFFVGLILGAAAVGIAHSEATKAMAALAVGIVAGFIAGIGMEDRFDLYQGDQYLRRREKGKR